VSEDLSDWRQLDSAPRYEPTDAGTELHDRVIGATDPLGQFKGPNRHVDQIWKLHAAGDLRYACDPAGVYSGTTSGPVYTSRDRGES
jgi:hypothetical protein